MANNMTFCQRLVARIVMLLFVFWLTLWFLYHYLKAVLSGQSDFKEWFSVSDVPELSVTQVPNPAIITRFSRSSNNLSGYPLVLELSIKSSTTCHVAYNIDVNKLHQVLLRDFHTLGRFFRTHGSREIQLRIGQDKVVIDRCDHELHSFPPQAKRTRYSVVVGLLSDCSDQSKEQIVVACYVIHIRLRPEESIESGVMYTFWKTNWNRLLTPQVMYAARDNSTTDSDYVFPTATDPIATEWTPSCFICLCDARDIDLRVLLPCRHAGVCPDCFQELRTKSVRISALGRLIECPLCRTPVTAVARMRIPVVCEEQSG